MPKPTCTVALCDSVVTHTGTLSTFDGLHMVPVAYCKKHAKSQRKIIARVANGMTLSIKRLPKPITVYAWAQNFDQEGWSEPLGVSRTLKGAQEGIEALAGDKPIKWTHEGTYAKFGWSEVGIFDLEMEN